MNQQINFYQERFHPKRVVLPVKEIYAFMGLTIVLLAVASLMLEVATQHILRLNENLSRQYQTVVKNNEELQSNIVANKVSPELQKAVADANQKLMARKRVLNWVKRSQSEERVLFSAILEGLARHNIEGLWLSEVTVDQKHNYLLLQGHALEPDLLPEFLVTLQKNRQFSGTEFKKIKIEEEESDSGVMKFLLTNKSLEG